MSDKTDSSAPKATPPTTSAAPEAPAAPPAADTQAAAGIDEIDFLLEEIESKIAPLALA